jgi:hypothetical protein
MNIEREAPSSLTQKRRHQEVPVNEGESIQLDEKYANVMQNLLNYTPTVWLPEPSI